MSRTIHRGRSLPWLTAAVVLALGTGPARAGEPEVRLREQRAEALFDCGIKASDRHEPAEALRCFREANALVPAPETLLNIVLTEIDLGLDLAAHRDIESYLALHARHDPQRQKEAEALRDDIEKELAHLTVVVEPAGATLLLDGARSELTAWLEPGAHPLRAEAKGRFPEERRVSLKMGDRRVVKLALRERPSWLDSPSHRAGLAIAMLGGAGLTTSAILGGLTLDYKLEMNRLCANPCSPEAASDYGILQQRALNLTFGVNLALLLGVALNGLGAGLILAPERADAARKPDLALSSALSVLPCEGGAVGLLGGTW